MRPSSLFLSLTFLLAIQFASVQTQTITGTWTNPYTLSSKSSLCCIPDSMKIEKTYSGMRATYVLPAIYMNQPCLKLFGSVTSATIDLTMQTTNLYSGSKYSQMGLTYAYFSYEAVSSSTLRVYSSYYSSSDQCSFSYSTHIGGGGSNSNTGFDGLPEIVKVIVWVFVFIVLGFCSYAKRQHQLGLRQNTVIVQPNLAFNSPPIYKAPDTIQFSTQTYVAPSQNTNPVFIHNANTYAAPSQNAYAPSNNVYVAPGDAYMAHQQAGGAQYEYAPPQSGHMDANHKNMYTPYNL